MREKEIEGLTKLLAEKRDSVRKARFEVAAKQAKNTKLIGNEKKDIARILTLIREKQGEAKLIV
ncbi:MAG: ribosomal protein [Patescibacteria group bacterium]|nr:ribosomal protein [Patescibacteria group bacterium]